MLPHCFCFRFWFFGLNACGMLAPPPGIEPTAPALEGEVLTTRPPGKSLPPPLLIGAQAHHRGPTLTASLRSVYLPNAETVTLGVKTSTRLLGGHSIQAIPPSSEKTGENHRGVNHLWSWRLRVPSAGMAGRSFSVPLPNNGCRHEGCPLLS